MSGWFLNTGSTLANNGVITTAAMTGKGFICTGFQLETRKYPTSYIKTISTPVTRAKDITSSGASVGTINSEAGALIVEAASDLSGAVKRFEITSPALANVDRVGIKFTATLNQIEFMVKTGAVNQILELTTVADITEQNTYAVSWESGKFRTFVNGVKETETLVGSTFAAATLDAINLHGNTESENFNARIKKIKLMSGAYTDAEIIAVMQN